MEWRKKRTKRRNLYRKKRRILNSGTGKHDVLRCDKDEELINGEAVEEVTQKNICIEIKKRKK